jgi:DNA (cytosine-5)-methyltransferase 1
MSKRAPLLRLRLDELIVDSFAGGGGASLGIEIATGRSPDIAINHDREALAMHAVNHPDSRHLCEDVWKVDPIAATDGKRIGLMWLSPDCKHFSKAKGGKPVEKKIRGLAWTVFRWIKPLGERKPRVIVLENVEEFEDWGPLLEDGRPCPLRKGFTFRRFVRQLEKNGYVVEVDTLVAADFGSPTTRKRLFLIARSDGLPITWPSKTHDKKGAAAGMLPWRPAAECIEWQLPCPSIFERKKDLAPNTMRRIARGVQRYVIDAAQPFIVGAGGPVYSAKPVTTSRPFGSLTTENHRALICPTLIQTGYGERQGQAPRAPGLDKPLGTVVGGGQKHALVSAFLAKHYGGHEGPGTPVTRAIDTITAQDHHSLVASSLIKFKGTCRDGQPMTDPLHTIQAGGFHYGEVRAFMTQFYGDGGGQEASLFEPARTIRSKECLALVTVAGEEYAIVDIGMRMLQPRELFRAQGFPDSYKIDTDTMGKPFTKSAQVRMCGNSVCPPVAAAIVLAQFTEVEQEAVA